MNTKTKLLTKVVLVAVMLTAASGCSPWVKVSKRYHTYSDTARNYRVELPRGWRQYGQGGDPLQLTKNGFTLQRFELHGNSLRRVEFAHTERTITEDMLPQDIAEVILDDLRLNQSVSGLSVLENAPAAIGGAPGFKLEVAFTTLDGLPTKMIVYGVQADGMLYRFMYAAPARHYFEQDRAAVEEMVESFSFLRAPKRTSAG